MLPQHAVVLDGADLYPVLVNSRIIAVKYYGVY